MLKYLLLLFSLGVAINASAACTALSISPSNPTPGQTVYFSLSGCNSSCYSSCLSSHAKWIINCQGSFVIGGTTYTNSAQISGTGFTAVFNANTNVTATFSTNGNCASPCNAYLTKTFVVGTVAPPPITRPSTSLVPSSLVNLWKTAGADKSTLPTTEECINVHSSRGIVSPFRDGYRVNVTNLNTLINGTNPNALSTVYFQAARYYFDKSETINLTRENLVLGGEGAEATKFIIDNITTASSADATTFISVSNRDHVGITCLSIDTRNAFSSSYWHDKDHNGKFKNKAIISFSNTEHSWIDGVRVHRGYGSTVIINGKGNNEVKNCFFYDQWTIGGTSSSSNVNTGGTQGYSILINKSDNNLIENNKLGLARHNVVIQGNSNDSNNDANKSDGNVVAYNYCYNGKARIKGFIQNHPWNITLHGKGRNSNNLIEGNLCADKLAIDAVHGSNGTGNTLYRNVSQIKIELEDSGTDCKNASQRFILNKANYTFLGDRYDIRSENHVIRGNTKCNGSGNSCSGGNFNVGDKCGFWTGNNKNDNLSSSQSGGQSCYLTSMPDFLNFLPFDVYDNLPAKSYTTALSTDCYTCTNVTLPGIKEPDPKDPKELDSNGAMKKADANEKDSKVELKDVENATVVAFPNPTSNNVTIRIEDAAVSNTVTFKLFDVSGKVVSESRVLLNDQNSFDYDLSRLEKGLYIGSIIANGKSYAVKLMKK